MERGKNRAIEFFRFFFCCGIFFHFGGLHQPEAGSWPFAGGYLGVEFFFLVAGWLMMPRLLRLPRGRAGLRPALNKLNNKKCPDRPKGPSGHCHMSQFFSSFFSSPKRSLISAAKSKRSSGRARS